jgi:hypothetical protein
MPPHRGVDQGVALTRPRSRRTTNDPSVTRSRQGAVSRELSSTSSHPMGGTALATPAHNCRSAFAKAPAAPVVTEVLRGDRADERGVALESWFSRVKGWAALARHRRVLRSSLSVARFDRAMPYWPSRASFRVGRPPCCPPPIELLAIGAGVRDG